MPTQVKKTTPRTSAKKIASNKVMESEPVVLESVGEVPVEAVVAPAITQPVEVPPIQDAPAQEIVVATKLVVGSEVKVDSLEPVKHPKGKKVKVIRDSFTMPEGEYEQIAYLKKRCLENGVAVKKSEILRAGLLALSKGSNQELMMLLGQLEKIKTGRRPK